MFCQPVAGRKRPRHFLFDFMKRTTIAQVKREGYAALAKHAHVLAKYEGFDAHANAVSELRDKLVK